MGFFAAFSRNIDERLLAFALIPFILAVAVGFLFSRGHPYRSYLAGIEEGGKVDLLRLSPEQWLIERIRYEEQIYPELVRGMERERAGVYVIQALVVVQIVYLIIIAAVS